MKNVAAARVGDIVLRGNRHVLIVAVADGLARVVPLIRGRTEIHRSDVRLPEAACLSLSTHNVVLRCCDAHWRTNVFAPRVGQADAALLSDVTLSLQREAQTREIEKLPAGIVRSVLGRGPRIGDCGRKVGGAPSD
ncbi:hypothetical protein AA101099_1791 [Neoasaia chiangmaiensis NBRC 101099]|uniref:Uncharacterized protein n=1 Tax=Neoasaia chiangmaiensis TaxID=320497 RepID=A0A1U9KR97_9PROT|nr:hypothetical protein [Neoasaia chiangmaiensis]AQS88252.1 hypothetical protein A0U93_10225 [Neoasaia chiangmaiensis]GBR39726.1 hypothetical protein AA101099_1791 [Neoasaia chiangmaiensis NBRC 101099]GEN14713.1 hypothetical protein NCH01_11440 [Neoasaia chiangmaiensis]